MTNKEADMRLTLAYEQLENVFNNLHYDNKHEEAEKLSKIMEQLVIYSQIFRNANYSEWLVDGIAYICSSCGKSIVVEQGTAELNYCPHCGKKMSKVARAVR